MHKIGLSHDGSLILFNHTPDEIRRYLTLGELGAEPSRCVSVYSAWVNGTINHEKFPRDISEFRHNGYEYAHRIQRKLRRVRLRAMMSKMKSGEAKQQLMEEYRTLIGPAVDPEEIDKVLKSYAKALKENSYQAANIIEHWFMYRVIEELVRRGWPAREKSKQPSDEEDKDSASPMFGTGYRGIMLHLFDETNAQNRIGGTGMGWRNNPGIVGIDNKIGHIVISTGGTDQYVSSFPADLKEPEDVRLQLAADVAEIGTVNELVREHRSQRHARMEAEFDVKAKAVKKAAGVTGVDIKPDAGSSTVVLSVTHSRLTIQAAQLLIKAFKSIEPKVRAILAANEKRLAAEHRFPPTPDMPVDPGGPVPKREKVAPIPAKWESAEEDTDDDAEGDAA